MLTNTVTKFYRQLKRRQLLHCLLLRLPAGPHLLVRIRHHYNEESTAHRAPGQSVPVSPRQPLPQEVQPQPPTWHKRIVPVQHRLCAHNHLCKVHRPVPSPAQILGAMLLCVRQSTGIIQDPVSVRHLMATTQEEIREIHVMRAVHLGNLTEGHRRLVQEDGSNPVILKGTSERGGSALGVQVEHCHPLPIKHLIPTSGSCA